MNIIPTKENNPNGLHQRYSVKKNQGQTDHNAEYFVLRLDTGGSDQNHINACRIGVNAYADAIEPFIPELAKDLKERYPVAASLPPQEVEKEEKLIHAYDEYIQLLSDELDEVVGMAAIHGWKSSRHEKGKELGERISLLKADLI